MPDHLTFSIGFEDASGFKYATVLEQKYGTVVYAVVTQSSLNMSENA